MIVKESEAETAYGLGLGSREEHKAEGFIGEGGGAQAAIGETELRANAWEHIATTYDGAYLRVYVDGELAGTEYAPTAPADRRGEMKIGCDIPDGQFTGRIDEARIYNRALSEAEVKNDLAPIQTPQQGPVASYSFDEGEGTTVEDLSGASHMATIEGATGPRKGRFGSAPSNSTLLKKTCSKSPTRPTSTSPKNSPSKPGSARAAPTTTMHRFSPSKQKAASATSSTRAARSLTARPEQRPKNRN